MSKSTNNYYSRFYLLAIFGAIISAWLLVHHVEVNNGYQTESSFCDISGFLNCTSVAQSDFSEIFGIPVAGYALWYYLALFFLVLLLGKGDENQKKSLGVILYYYCLVGLLPTIAMAGISFLMIGALCSMCLALYILSILLFILAWRNPHLLGDGSRSISALGKAISTGLFGVLSSSLGGLSLIFLIALGIGVVLSKGILIENYFEPRRKVLNAEKNLAPIYEMWSKAEVVEAIAAINSNGPGESPSKGSAEASLVLVEFSDFQCPYCAKASQYLARLNKELPEVLIVFKNFPLDPACNKLISAGHGHDKACKAAKMAACAGQQERQKFWEMHDKLFALTFWSDESLSLLAEELMLDTASFEKCINSPQIEEKIINDIELGLLAKVAGTPSFYLNGKPIEGLNLQALIPFVKYVKKRQSLN